MKPVTSVKDFKGKKVFVRVDFDVDVDEKGKVVDDTRIVNSLESVRYVLEKNGIAIIAGHYGREGASMEPIFKYIKNSLDISFAKSFEFVADPLSEEGKKKIKELQKGEAVVIENLRSWPEEESNDENFAKNLAELAHVYVDEAFSAAHRKHASIVGIPKFVKEKYVGAHFVKEVEGLSKSFNPPHPFLFILGGAKLETKIPLLEKFLNIADSVFVGGTLAVPASKDEKLSSNPKIFFPLCDYSALDADLATVNLILEKARGSKFVLWNGPLGKYEDDYTEGTKALAQGLSELYENGIEVIVGGGDTLAAIKELGIEKEFTFVSTSGGAMLDFLANGTLPGIEALEK